MFRQYWILSTLDPLPCCKSYWIACIMSTLIKIKYSWLQNYVSSGVQQSDLIMHTYACVLSLQLCSALWDPVDCNLPSSSFPGILQAGILERVAIPFSSASSRYRDRISISYVSSSFSYVSCYYKVETLLPTKVRLVKAMVFLVVMYGCESWTTKKAEHQKIDSFELWCWRRLLSVPWTVRRSNKTILKEISPAPQTQQFKQDEEREEYPADKGTE